MTVANLVAHVVWVTRNRDPMLVPSIDPWLASTVAREAAMVRADALAIGNASDHVHLLVRYPPTLPVAQMVQRLKSASSRLYNARGKGRLDWQAGYWVESVGSGALVPLCRQVTEQRERHLAGTDVEAWESQPMDEP
jgi:putative transposase